MNFLPFKNETIVVPHTREEILERLNAVVNPVDENGKVIHEDNSNFLFNGRVYESGKFRISKKINVSSNFLPLIIGNIESSNKGSIIFIKYRLFFTSWMFLIFWSLIAIIAGIYILANKPENHYAIVAFGFLILNYAVTIVNFDREIKRTKQFLDEVFR